MTGVEARCLQCVGLRTSADVEHFPCGVSPHDEASHVKNVGGFPFRLEEIHAAKARGLGCRSLPVM